MSPWWSRWWYRLCALPAGTVTVEVQDFVDLWARREKDYWDAAVDFVDLSLPFEQTFLVAAAPKRFYADLGGLQPWPRSWPRRWGIYFESAQTDAVWSDDAKIPFIDAHDVAAVAAACMAESGPEGILPLTRPEAIDHHDVARAAGFHDPAPDFRRRVPALEYRRGRKAIRHGDARVQGRARARGHLEDHRLHAGGIFRPDEGAASQMRLLTQPRIIASHGRRPRT